MHAGITLPSPISPVPSMRYGTELHYKRNKDVMVALDTLKRTSAVQCTREERNVQNVKTDLDKHKHNSEETGRGLGLGIHEWKDSDTREEPRNEE